MKKSAARCAVFLALSYATNAVYQGFSAKFYQERGVRGGRLMTLLLCFPLLAAVSQPFWGMLCDRARSRTAALRAAVALSLPLALLMARADGFFALLALSCAFAAVYPAIQPLSESIVLEALHAQGAPYGPVRLWGSAAFAAGNLLFGRLLRGGYGAVPYYTGGGLFCMLLGVFLLPRAPKRRRGSAPAAFLQVLRLPHIKKLLALMMLLQMTLGYFFAYFALYFTALPGGSPRLLALAYFIGSVSEIPFLLWGDRCFDRFGAGRLLLLSAVSLLARFAVLGLCRSVAAALACQALHGLGFVVVSFSMSKYVALTAPETLKTSAQTLLTLAGFGFSRVLGVLCGGLISQRLADPACGFLLMAAVCLLSLPVFAPLFIRLPPLNGK